MRSWVTYACATCFVLGCGPKPEVKAPSPKPVDTAPQIVEEAPDLSPVKRPAEVVVVGRIARPRLFAETLAKWGSLPLRLEDLMPEQARAMSRAVLWEAPVEMVVALDAFGEGTLPAPLLIGSVGLKSVDEALSAADAMQLPTRKVAPGIFRVGDFPDTSCAVAVSLGSAPARLICGHGVKDVDALLPYATRGLPSEPQTAADFELTLDAKPIQDHYGRDVTSLRLLAGVGMRELALDSQRFDRALSDAIYGSVDETINLFNDLDQVRFDARIEAARNVLTGSAELRLKGESSWTAGTIAATKAAALPATLPRLPPGSTLACYTSALPAERYAAIGRVLGELSDGLLEHEKLPDATRKRARRVIDAWFSKMPESFGFAVSPSQKDSIGFRHPDTAVTRLSEPSARVMAAFNDFFGLVTDPAVKRWAKSKSKMVDDKAWPKVKKTSLKLAGFKTPATVFELTTSLKAWAAIDQKLADNLSGLFPPSVDGENLGFDFVVQPDGDITYVMSGDDTKEMTRVMAEHKKNEPGVFFAKPAHNDRVVAAGFVTLAYLARSFDRNLAMQHGMKQGEVGKALAGAPNHGESPLTFSTTTGPGVARVDIEVPAAAFADATAAFAAAAPALKDVILAPRP